MTALPNKMGFDDLELTESEKARKKKEELEAWRNRSNIAYEFGQALAGVRGRTMFAD